MFSKQEVYTVENINKFFPVVFAVVFLLVAIPVITYHYFANDLASKERIMNYHDTGLVLLDKDGEAFFTFYDAKSREEIPLAQIPQHVQDAVVAMEDKDFYRHEGYSIPSIIRSFYANMTSNEIVQGGSTITQQLVKNALLNPQKSYLRKYQEVMLAREIERRYTKPQILEMYLNSVYFGEGAFGIEQAAEVYFDKSASELTIAEAALLAGILPAPSAFSPLSGDREQALSRQQIVLTKMVEQGYITTAELNEAVQTKLAFDPEQDEINAIAPHFALWVKDQLIQKYGEEDLVRAGLKVTTTLDSEWQRYAEDVAANQIANLSSSGASNSSVVAIEPGTGEVRVMVGSVDWYDNSFGKVNVALQPRQPGSSFKPIVYAAALERGIITPATVLQDKKTTFANNYQPENYDRRYRGPVTVRKALSNSLNIPAVEVMTKLDVPMVLSSAQELGIDTLRSPEHYGPSLVLGTGEIPLLEMTNAYATFANRGKYTPVTAITKIIDKNGKVIYRHKSSAYEVISEQAAFLISSILSDDYARAEVFGNALTISRPAAVKTGTTDEYRDAWTIGYTPNYTVGVWVGNNDNAPMSAVAGSLGAAPIWREVMEYGHQNIPVEGFVQPSGVIAVNVCRNNGLRLPPGAPANAGYTEYFLQGSEPQGYCRISPPKEKKEEDQENQNSPTSSPEPTSANLSFAN